MSRSLSLVSDRRPIGRMVTLLCGAMTTAGLGFSIQFALSHALSVPSYGRLVAMLAAANVLTPVACGGMGWLWLQAYGSEGWSAHRWIAVSLRAVGITSCAAVVLLVAYVVATEIAPFSNVVLVSAVMIPIMLGQSLVEMASARWQLEERYELLTAWQLLIPFGRALVVVAIFVAGYRDLWSVLVGFALIGGGAGLISMFSIEQVRRGRIKLAGHGETAAASPAQSRPRLRVVFVEALPFVMMSTFPRVCSQGVVAIIEQLVGASAAAICNVAYLIVSTVYLVPSVIYTKYLVSKVFRWWVHDRQMFNAALHVGVAVQLILGVLGMAVVMLAAPLVVPFIFGARYSEAVPVLMVLAISIPIRFVQHAYASAFYSKEHMWRKVAYMGISAAISVILSITLTPIFGLPGAALSSVASELSLLLLFFRGVGRHVGGINVWSTFRPSILRQSMRYIGGLRETQS
jgi:O-antigen/teichoic acid export membrane protein